MFTDHRPLYLVWPSPPFIFILQCSSASHFDTSSHSPWSADECKVSGRRVDGESTGWTLLRKPTRSSLEVLPKWPLSILVALLFRNSCWAFVAEPPWVFLQSIFSCTSFDKCLRVCSRRS